MIEAIATKRVSLLEQFAHPLISLQQKIEARQSNEGIGKGYRLFVECVAAVDEKIIDLSLASDFNDFEDSVQYYLLSVQRQIASLPETKLII